MDDVARAVLYGAVAALTAWVAFLVVATILFRHDRPSNVRGDMAWRYVGDIVVVYSVAAASFDRSIPMVGNGFQRANVFELMDPGHKLPVAMHDTDATGCGLATNGNLGADLIRVEAGQSFPMHTHPGDHLLLVIRGNGTVTIGGVVHATKPGDLYMVPGLVEHSVGAVEEHFLMSVGSPHKMLDAHDRMQVME